MADVLGRRWAMIIPTVLGFSLTPVYLLTNDYMTIVIPFTPQGPIWGGTVALAALTYVAVNLGYGFAHPMLILTSAGRRSFVVALIVGPETKGKEIVADLKIIPVE